MSLKNSFKQIHNGKIMCLPIHLQVSYKVAWDPTSIQIEMAQYELHLPINFKSLYTWWCIGWSETSGVVPIKYSWLTEHLLFYLKLLNLFGKSGCVHAWVYEQ